MTDSLAELRRLAELASVLPWESSPADIPYAHKKQFQDAATPTVILRLVRIAQAAERVDALVIPPIVEPAFAALREALGEKP